MGTTPTASAADPLSDAWPGLLGLADLGPFFAIAPLDPSSDWRPMAEFANHPDGLAAALATVQQSLTNQAVRHSGSANPVHARVAASVGFLGLAARLISPAIGFVCTTGLLPEFPWRDLAWRTDTGGAGQPAQLRLAGGQLTAVRPANGIGPPEIRQLFRTTILPVLELGDVVADRYRVSPQVIRGNIASAIFGAVAVIRWRTAAGDHHRKVAEDADRLAAGLLAEPELAGTGIVAPIGRLPSFRRRSCCLLYRVPGATLCGDCILGARRPVATSSPPAAAAGLNPS
ncbi:MAG: (2Fe-2S)-binding protein [Nakamurella sp.]